MEEEEEQRGYSVGARVAGAILALLAYVVSVIPIAMLEKLGYLDPIKGTPIIKAIQFFYMPLSFLYHKFPPYTAFFDFMMGLV